VKKPKVTRFDFGGTLIDWPNAKALPLLADGQPMPSVAPVAGRIRD
jgi:hypothetical protein